MNQANDLAAILEAMKKAQAAPLPNELAKSWTQSASATTGLTYYDLEAPAKTLYPVITPLRNEIPRDMGGMGIQAAWKAITGININNVSAGVGFGQRGGAIATSTADYSAAFKALGLEDYVDFEADLAGKGFDDIRARAVQGLLRSMMIQEERIILGGNSSLALGTTATPTLAGSSSGGSLATQTLSVICVALTLDGLLNSSISGGVVGAISRTNQDSTTASYGGGSGTKSAAATVSLTGPTASATGTVAPKQGAVAYAWFWGVGGSELLGAITTINSVAITAAATGTQNASALTGDNSTNNLVFDGLLTQICKPLGAYFVQQATGTAGTGTPLTADGLGGIVEIDAALKYYWDNYRLSPTAIYVNSQELQNISKKVLTGSSTAAQRFVFNADQGALGGGVIVREYLNKFGLNGPSTIPIRLHPNMPAGTIMFYTTQIPYPLSNVSDVLKIKGRRDYYQIEWPIRTRRYEYGVYADEVLQNYFPPAFGMITNIGNG